MRFSHKSRLIIFLLVIASITACSRLETQDLEEKIPSYEEQYISVEDTEVIETKDARIKRYADSLTQEEIEHVEELAREFYETSFPYELVSIELSSDSNVAYRYYEEYEPGNIIIFKVKTTHEGDGSLYRDIVFGRDSMESEWERLNEGY